MNKARLRAGDLAVCALFTALLSVCAQLVIPLPGVPLNMALFAVHLAALLLGPRRAAASVAAYLLLGTFGAPVFSSFSSGPAVLLGPSGGFLFGYLFCALAAGRLSRRMQHTPARSAQCALAGLAACALPGVLWFTLSTGAEVSFSFVLYWLVFLPGDLLKIALAVLLSARLRSPLRAMGLTP